MYWLSFQWLSDLLGGPSVNSAGPSVLSSEAYQDRLNDYDEPLDDDYDDCHYGYNGHDEAQFDFWDEF